MSKALVFSKVLIVIAALVLGQTAVQSAELSGPSASPHVFSAPLARPLALRQIGLVPKPVERLAPVSLRTPQATRAPLAVRKTSPAAVPTARLTAGPHLPQAKPVIAARRTHELVLPPAPMPIGMAPVSADDWVLLSV